MAGAVLKNYKNSQQATQAEKLSWFHDKDWENVMSKNRNPSYLIFFILSYLIVPYLIFERKKDRIGNL